MKLHKPFIMQKITFAVLLVLVAFASAFVSGPQPDMTVVFDLLDRISKVDPQTIEKILNTENLTKLNKQDAKMAQLARLLERISKVDWEAAYIYSVENQFTFDHELSIDGGKLSIQDIFELLASIAKMNWTELKSLFVTTGTTLKVDNGSKDGQLDMVKVEQRAKSMLRLRQRLQKDAAAKRPKKL